MKTISELMKNPNFREVDHNRTKVNPFPGRFSTRWNLILLDDHKAKRWSYRGKPSLEVAVKVRRLCLTHRGTVILTEYDRLGIFRQTIRRMPCANFQVTAYVGNPCYFYSPWFASTRDFFAEMRKGVAFSKQMVLGKRTFWVNAPHEVMLTDPNTLQQLREYRTWINKTKPLS